MLEKALDDAIGSLNVHIRQLCGKLHRSCRSIHNSGVKVVSQSLFTKPLVEETPVVLFVVMASTPFSDFELLTPKELGACVLEQASVVIQCIDIGIENRQVLYRFDFLDLRDR